MGWTWNSNTHDINVTYMHLYNSRQAFAYQSQNRSTSTKLLSICNKKVSHRNQNHEVSCATLTDHLGDVCGKQRAKPIERCKFQPKVETMRGDFVVP